MFIGLDFGTTNSALAVAPEHGAARLVPVRHGEETLPTFRSILYFDDEERDPNGRPHAFAGPAAMDAYLMTGADGRLIQSIKSWLANPTFTATSIFGSRFTLENLVGFVVARLVDATEEAGALAQAMLTGPVVVGRPARFVRNSLGTPDTGHDDLAVSRLRGALAGVRIPQVHFEFEPVAAAYAYEASLVRDELVLIGDFGGGTSDFCLLHVGPGLRGLKDRGETIVGVSGVGIAGDAFDARIVEHAVAPRLGKGTSYASGGKTLPVPSWLYDTMKRWHQLSMINTGKTRRMLEEISQTAEAPAEVAGLLSLIAGERGFALYRAVEAAKVALSDADAVRLGFETGPVTIDAEIARADFDRWIAPELAEIEACVVRLLEETGIAPAQVDRVFLTGGSAFIPAVRRLFSDRFGPEKLAGGGELTSVATGLALAARQRFGA
ncbi:Hsp70 family protein [Parvibaculum sp.]|uniref:Hsp70 family protein n=1 Tax=Parvibaculum sp. TaxID=2024848 RepID=UPI001D440888|nr:Hsp70 family protein [Parvibaculum sp.]MBX3489891.1 Hsp70 family protein [Parvibaculum sp.]MCW5726121.1 Hsp70 family protein [Parvibaculum sp.]